MEGINNHRSCCPLCANVSYCKLFVLSAHLCEHVHRIYDVLQLWPDMRKMYVDEKSYIFSNKSYKNKQIINIFVDEMKCDRNSSEEGLDVYFSNFLNARPEVSIRPSA